MKFDVVTIFPRMLQAPIEDGIVHRAIEAGLVSIGVHDLRAYTDDRHRSVDDQPFGGGPGMVMKAEPFLRAVETLTAAAPDASRAVVLLSPRGQRFDQRMAERLCRLDHVVRGSRDVGKGRDRGRVVMHGLERQDLGHGGEPYCARPHERPRQHTNQPVASVKRGG